MRRKLCCQRNDKVIVSKDDVIGVSYHLQDPEALERSKPIEDIVTSLKNGHFLWKVRSFSKWYRRRYALDTEQMRVYYDTSYKAPCLEGETAIDLAEIADVRKGWKTDVFNRVGTKVEKQRKKSKGGPPILEEQNCFSIIYGRDKSTLDLVAPTETACDHWVKGLTYLLTVIRGLEQEKNYEQWLRNQFNQADADHTGSLNFQESKKLLKQLNIELNEKLARRLFEAANTDKRERNGEQVLDVDEFINFYFNLLKRPELEDLFIKYAQNNNAMGASELCLLLQNEQRLLSITTDECKHIIQTFEQSDLKENNQLSLAGFTNMMLSEKFELFNSEHRIIYQDMTQPLAHYYIASSHNTYLTGHQLSGKSSVEGYIEALKNGCRCVELDCWDGEHGEPIIYHGYTLTSKISFKDVIVDAVKAFAFHSSQYPVILSLENHCSEKQQDKMGKILKDTLGNMLYTVDADTDMTELPSPEDLKGKIIIKAKKAKSRELLLHIHSDGDEEESTTDEEPDVGNQVDFIDSDEPKNQKTFVVKGGTSGKKQKIISTHLSDLVNICQATHFQGFQHAKEKQRCYQMSSFMERKSVQLIEDEGRQFVKFNQRQLSRIYPAGKRTASSNYNAIPHWNAGCQLVALNYQTEGKAMFFHKSKFMQNGNCGYILKPKPLLEEFIEYDPVGNLHGRYKKILKIKIISGQHLPKPAQKTEGEVVDPYVLVKVRGHPTDKQKHKTNFIRNNGFNPVWDELFEIPIEMPELALLYFVVKDYSTTGKNEAIGANALPFTSMTEGYRHVYLMDYAGRYCTPASLFVHISISDPK